MDKRTQYTIAKTLHWLAFVLITFNVLGGWRLGNFETETRQILVGLHAGVGILIFLFMAGRWWWRRSNRLYAPKNWWRKPLLLGQWVFYPILIVQTFIGIALAAVIDLDINAFGFLPFSALAPNSADQEAWVRMIHASAAWSVLALITLHTFDKIRWFYTEKGGN
ncbi:cytochrome b-561 membrane protein [gamma proteobacterium HdN1]|nr:cytochrome b-561 membrane protein [gamma proteobacterium HdN1]